MIQDLSDVPPLLQAQGLGKRYGAHQALQNFDLCLHAGESVGLLGSNGAGKSTALSLLQGLQKSDTGTLLFMGAPLDKNYPRHIGILFQNTTLQSHLTVGETLRFFASLYPQKHHPLKKTCAAQAVFGIADLKQRCVLGPIWNQRCEQLSGGQRQRLLLAIALVASPKILFVDEPSTGLDPKVRQSFWDILQSVKKEGTAIIIVTHDLNEAHTLCDRWLVLEHGKIIATRAPASDAQESAG